MGRQLEILWRVALTEGKNLEKEKLVKECWQLLDLVV